MLEPYWYKDGTIYLCDDHYMYGESTLTFMQIRTLVRTCRNCVIDYNRDE